MPSSPSTAPSNGRARLIAEAPLGLGEPPDAAYPLVLTVGRYLGHWHTLSRTVHVERARQRHPGPLLEVHPSDATPLGLTDGAIAQVSSRRGSVRVPVLLSTAIRPGVVFLPMHWDASQPEACEANRLMHELGCPLSKQPELKAAAVRLVRAEPEGDAPPHGA